ncbi:MAG: hypothetical protein NC398_06240 [Acetatifactor muris]|nr:hypothetical protein [Acetatifactor muris]MCM1526652.1 hypothetical protein [Bacteroides sp.]
MKKVALCIPTYNRAEEIRTVLEKELDFLHRHAVDVHIFDSSETETTKRVVTGYGHYENLYYHAVDSSIRSNEKVFHIYRDYADQYEYVWVIHDHTIFTEDALCYILEQLDDRIGYYFLQFQSNSYEREDITDRERLLYETAWLSGRYGTVILKSEGFLRETDWEYFSRKYLTDEMWNYAQIGFCFERASQIADFKARILRFPRDLFTDISTDRKIGWYQDCVRVCLECWGEVISSLPDSYTNKQAVLQTQDKWFISKYSLITYKKNRVYNFGMYWRYRKWIKKIAPDESENAFWISFLPVSASWRIYTRKLILEIRRNRSDGREICIYGAGRHATECLEYLECCGVDIDAFLVTKEEGNPDRIREYPVYQADGYVREHKVFAVIAIMSDKVDEIKTYLDSLEGNAPIRYMEFV